MPGDALLQNPSALQNVQASSKDNLAAVAGNRAPPAETYVPPPFAPPGAPCGVGATVKSTTTVLHKKGSVETQMEVEDQQVTTSSGRPPVPSPKPAKSADLPMPVIVNEAGMKQCAHTMLSGCPVSEQLTLNNGKFICYPVQIGLGHDVSVIEN